MDLGPGELRIPLPMPIDVALNAPLRHVRGDILQAVADDPESMIVFRSHVSILKGKGFVFTQESVEGSSPIRVRFPLGSDGRFEARLVEGPWVAEWASDQGIPHTQAFRVTAAEGPQTLTLGRP